MGTVYMTQNGKRDDDFAPYVWKSTDYGKTWVDIATGIPLGPVNVIREDPVDREHPLCRHGRRRLRHQRTRARPGRRSARGLPFVYVHDLIIHPRDNIIVIATHGRGMWALDANPINGKDKRPSRFWEDTNRADGRRHDFDRRNDLFLGLSLPWPWPDRIFGGAKSRSGRPALKTVESTDPALRLKWAEQHHGHEGRIAVSKDLKWRFIGPDDHRRPLHRRRRPQGQPNGRSTSARPRAASGRPINAGVDLGAHLIDDCRRSPIGDLAVAESDPNIVWLGTGEANIFRASDRRNRRLQVDRRGQDLEAHGARRRPRRSPGSSSIRPIPTSSMSRPPATSGPTNPDRGVFKTTDGGKTWQKVLYVNEKVGAIDLVMDPAKPDTLIAATWNRIRRRWSDPIPGGEDGLFKTTDGGKTWKPIDSGPSRHELDRPHRPRPLPDQTQRRLRLRRQPQPRPRARSRASATPTAGCKTSRNIVGAEVYRSDDQGGTWRKVSAADALMERFGGTYGWVFGQIRVDPNDAEHGLHHGPGPVQVDRRRQDLAEHRREDLHGDHHGLWIDPDRLELPDQRQRRRRQRLLRRRQELAGLPQGHPDHPVLQRRP